MSKEFCSAISIHLWKTADTIAQFILSYAEHKEQTVSCRYLLSPCWQGCNRRRFQRGSWLTVIRTTFNGSSRSRASWMLKR
jgi:hypothetical protein